MLDRPEKQHIEGLAERITHHKYQMRPVVRELLGSRLFFSDAVRGSLIKSPIELVIGTYRTLGRAAHLPNTLRLLADLGQDVFEPPSVKGWEGGRQWISSTTLLKRTGFATELMHGNGLYAAADPSERLLAVLADHPKELAAFIVELLLARDLNPDTAAAVTDTIQQNDQSPDQQIRGLAHLIMTLPEYQPT